MKNFLLIAIPVLMFLAVEPDVANAQNVTGGSRLKKSHVLVSGCTAIGDTVYIEAWWTKELKSDKHTIKGMWAKAYDENGNIYSEFEFKTDDNRYDKKKTLRSNEAKTAPVVIKIAGIPDNVCLFKSISIPFQVDEEHIGDIRKYYRTITDEIQIIDLPVHRESLDLKNLNDSNLTAL